MQTWLHYIKIPEIRSNFSINVFVKIWLTKGILGNIAEFKVDVYDIAFPPLIDKLCDRFLAQFSLKKNIKKFFFALDRTWRDKKETKHVNSE